MIEPEDGCVECSLYLRDPVEMRDKTILVNGCEIELSGAEGGYLRLSREFAAGDVVEIRGTIPLTREASGGSVAFRYGPIVLARDENKEPDFFCQAPQTDETLSYDVAPYETEFLCSPPGKAFDRAAYGTEGAEYLEWYYQTGDTVRRMNGYMEKCGYLIRKQ